MALPEGIPIKDMSWEQLKEAENQLSGWVYPRRNISPFISAFPTAQQVALNFYGWISIIMFIAGFCLSFFMGSWWWLLLIPGAVAVWRANRTSMEQFFLQNLKEDQAFYDAIRQTEMGEMVKVVFRQD